MAGDSTPGGDDLSAFRADVHAALARFRRLKTVHVNAERDRDDARALVQRWFRSVRPALVHLGLGQDDLGPVDGAMQAVLRLAGGRSRRHGYVDQLKAAHDDLGELEVQKEVAISDAAPAPEGPARSALEEGIIGTLERLVPSAARSYVQALHDLADADRVSYRGTANELRSVLWDVLERLAPDDDVVAAPGYKHEKGRDKPTQRQKARYILRSRSVPQNARQAPETTVQMLEDHVSALTRANYTRSSISAHVAAVRPEVLQIKTYLDGVLAELLQVHSR